MYKRKKYRVRSIEEVKADLRSALPYRGKFRRIFLCDGDAFALPTSFLTEILEDIRSLFPELEAVRVYASARNVLEKTTDELKSLATLGLDMAYIGLESGSDRVLASINKGLTRQEMIDSAALMKRAGIKQSVSIIAGLGGEAMSEEHVTETADALNKMQPEYLGMLVLRSGGDSGSVYLYDEDRPRLPSAKLVLAEMRLLLENLELNDCFFTSAHISNYLYVKGRLPRDRHRMLEQISKV
jgi:radical SAM superfamily enzyme YgiQ (UPF0313 family)